MPAKTGAGHTGAGERTPRGTYRPVAKAAAVPAKTGGGHTGAGERTPRGTYRPVAKAGAVPAKTGAVHTGASERTPRGTYRPVAKAGAVPAKPSAGRTGAGERTPRGPDRPVPEAAGAAKAAGRTGPFWLYGVHAVRAALANPRRKIRRVVLTRRVGAELGPALLKGVSPEWVEVEAVGRLLPHGSVHQGIALYCDPLPDLELEEVLQVIPPGRRLVAVLDQVTDPHNEGAILRSAAAFGVAAVVVQERHGPPESGALAKAASGALDLIPRVTVVNIARALEELGRLGFWRIALAGDGEGSLREAAAAGDLAVVLGAEGAGLRRLVRERCDVAAFIPMSGGMESLNVSNAAAIAFYELRQARERG